MLRRHPLAALGIVLLGALLAALEPLLQIRLGLPDELTTQAALGFAAIIPLELYFVPRFLVRLDAEASNRPENPQDGWRERFEERWLKAFGTRMLVYLAVALGMALFVLPGLVLALMFGWAPLRVLLRGDSLGKALSQSLAIAARTWPRVLRTGLLLLGVYLLCIWGLGWCATKLVPIPGPWQRLIHPAIWIGRIVSGFLDLLLSTCFLALYLSAERALEEPTETA